MTKPYPHPHPMCQERGHAFRVGMDTCARCGIRASDCSGQRVVLTASLADFAQVCADQPDNVNSPSHYTTGGIECFDAMRAMLSDEEMIGYLRGNSFKYRWRFRHKGGAEDLKKAEWYERKLLEIVDNSA